MQKQTMTKKVLTTAVTTTLMTAITLMSVTPAMANNTAARKYNHPAKTSQVRTAAHGRRVSEHRDVNKARPTYHTAAKQHSVRPANSAHQAGLASHDVTSNAKLQPVLTKTEGDKAMPIVIETRKPVSVASTEGLTVANIATPVSAATTNNNPIAPTPAKSQFVAQMVSNTDAVNAEILRERAKMLNLQADVEQGKTLSDANQTWLTDLATRYHVSNPDFQSPTTWAQLNQKVDAIPTSLVLGQSIQESGWGASSIAKRAHNYFGQKCGSNGCYPGTRYQSFSSMRAAVTAYIHNLNSNGAYKALRLLRFEARNQDAAPNSIVLANGLNAYSTLRGNYISAIKNVITSLNLQRYDQGDNIA